MKQKGRPKKINNDEPNDAELKKAERQAKKLKQQWLSDIEELRKQLREAEEIGYDEDF